MQVNDILLQARSFLNDQDSKEYRWSDEELISLLNSSLALLATKLFLFTNNETFVLIENTNRYKLPYNFDSIISVNIDKQPVIIKSFSWMSQNKYSIDDDNLYICLDEQSFFLYPIDSIKDDMQLELEYNYTQTVQKKDDDIPVSIKVKNALIYYTVHQALLVKVSKSSDTNSAKFLNLFTMELERLDEIYSKNRHSKKLRFKYKRV
jgi:hypothetical protein